MATVKRNGSFAEFWIHDACVWQVSLSKINTHQDLANEIHQLAEDFEWFHGDVVREFETFGEQHLNRY